MAEYSVATKILKSSIWQYLGSWLNKIIGFVSTIILARILVPDDFGIVAAASIVTGVFHVVATVGTEQYLIRKKEISDSELNTGWTINVIMNSMAAIGIFLLASPIANYMADDRLILVLQIISISSLLAGFNNIGLVLYQKEFNYQPNFYISVISRVVGFVVKIILALYFQNYWAFIIAEILEVTIFMIGSFIAHPYRPQFSLANWKQQWLFSQWILLKSIFVFLRFRIDNILISHYLPIEALGKYTIAKDLAILPAEQIISPIMQPLYVGLSEGQDNELLFAARVHKCIALLFIVIIPISFGIYATADNLVYVLLGEKWLDTIPLVMVISWTLIPSVLGDLFTRIMTVKGKVKLIFKIEFFLGLLTICTFLFFAENMTLLDFAKLRVITIMINTFIVLVTVIQISKLSLIRIIGLILPPFIASAAMLYLLVSISPVLSSYDNEIQFVVQVFIGITIYICLISSFVYLLRNRVKEYLFVWKTFYLSSFLR